MSDDVLGVVLAGGASRRMGHDKAALMLGGRPLLAWVVEVLRAAFAEVAVIGPLERAALVPGVSIVRDEYPGQGPLGGIATALAHSGGGRIFVAACDMPFLDPALVRYLAELAPEAAAVVPRSVRGIEPLCGCYGPACLPVARALLARGELALLGLLGALPTRIVAPAEWQVYDRSGRSLLNVNTPEDWAAARAFL
ncbi:MAG TPA: molybdenum cofactor guanylyltransferase [Ktedonobacterales bacterium]|nr:molybdenum cofactor guanylyltransferase [Ktedonobacterales bacterium]